MFVRAPAPVSSFPLFLFPPRFPFKLPICIMIFSNNNIPECHHSLEFYAAESTNRFESARKNCTTVFADGSKVLICFAFNSIRSPDLPAVNNCQQIKGRLGGPMAEIIIY